MESNYCSSVALFAILSALTTLGICDAITINVEYCIKCGVNVVVFRTWVSTER
jgi:hypothetical protein